MPEIISVRMFRKAVRQAVADYIQSEGCGCCESYRHSDHKAKLAKLLRVPKYHDGSGYNFPKFKTKGAK